MKPGQIRDMSGDQIADTLRSLRREALNLRFRQASGQLENTAQMRLVRRDIARLLTVQRARRAGREEEK